MPDAPLEAATPIQRLAAWSVHLYTAMGLPLALLGVQALIERDAGRFLLLNILAVLIDSTDGSLARRLRVKQRVAFDGALLDNIVDFLTYTFLPALALVQLELLPPGQSWLAALPVLASAYQFCQAGAKTEDAFVGFPSYWNVLLLYLVVLAPPFPITAALLLGLSALVFVPLRYVYPSRTRLLRPLTLALCTLYGLAAVALALHPRASWAPGLAWASLAFIGYYLVLSLVHHHRTRSPA